MIICCSEPAFLLRTLVRSIRQIMPVLVVCVFSPHVRADVEGAFEFGPGAFTGGSFSIPLVVDFSSDANEQLVFFGVNISASDGILTQGGMDYGRFSFELDPALASWEQLPGTGFGTGPLQSTIEFDTITDPVPAGRHALGQLLVDLSDLDLTELPASVRIESPNTVIGVEQLNMPATFDFVSLEFRPGEAVIVVPEPSSCFFVSACLLFGGLRSRRIRV